MIFVSSIQWEEKNHSLPEEVTIELDSEDKNDERLAEDIFDHLFMTYGTEAKTFTFSEATS